MSINSFQEFTKIKNQVNDCLERLHRCMGEYDKTSIDSMNEIKLLQTKLLSTSFKVLVVGEFSNGKSTFLNALLGDKILDTQTTETTATINILKYGTSSTAYIHYWGERNESGVEISQGKKVEVDIKSLKDFSATAQDGNEKAQQIKFIEIFHPSKYCSNGVELIDTPGLNTVFIAHELCTLDFLPNGHAAIVLLNATQFLNGEDEKYVRSFRRYMTKFLFVANRIDEMNFDDPDEPMEWYVGKYWPKKLKNIIESETYPKIYPMNSKLAESGNWADSGMQAFVRDLENFLTSSEKAKEMIRPVANQAIDILCRETTKIDGLLHALEFSPDEFDKRVQVNLPKLEKAKSTQKDILRFIDERTKNIALRYENYATDILEEFASEVKANIALFEGDIDELKESLPQDIKLGLSRVIMDIQEYTNAEIRKLSNEISRRYEDLCGEINAVKQEISSSKSFSLRSDESIALYSANEGTGAFQDLLMTFGGSAGIGALAAFILTGPIGWIAGILGGGIWTVFMAEKQRKKELTNLSDRVYKELHKMMSVEVPKGAVMIGEASSTLKQVFNKGIMNSIRDIDAMIAQIKRERAQTEEKINHDKKEFNKYTDALREILNDVTALKTILSE